jgi:hypothetical protein
MRRPQLAFRWSRAHLYAVIVCVALICLSARNAAPVPLLQATGGDSSCSDSIKSCKKPVKFISKDNACYTFACEYGTATQHNIHVSKDSDVRALLQETHDGVPN